MLELPSLLIGVPVLNRPQNAAPLVESVREATPEATILFLISRGDTAELLACDELLDKHVRAEIMPFDQAPGDFARKHNHAFARAAAEGFEFYFVGADDIHFHPGWYEKALKAQRKTGGCVVGTNDLGNPRTARGWHSTHFLVHVDYRECGTIDEPGKLLNDSYRHEFSDDEAIQTARFRRTYVHAFDSYVAHNHPDWGKAERDSTYELAQAGRLDDSRLFESRKHLWSGRWAS